MDKTEGQTCPEEFILHLQHALLLALQEQGAISIPEYRSAEERLYREGKKRQGGDFP